MCWCVGDAAVLVLVCWGVVMTVLMRSVRCVDVLMTVQCCVGVLGQ